MKVLLGKRFGGICWVECILNRVVCVVITEKGKFECRLKQKKVAVSPVVPGRRACVAGNSMCKVHGGTISLLCSRIRAFALSKMVAIARF